MPDSSEDPPIALSRHAHDRIARRRVDQEWLDQAWAAPGTRVLEVAGTRFRTHGRAPDWVPPGRAPDGLRVLLGELRGEARFAVITPPDMATDKHLGLRAAMALLGEDAELVVHAVAMAEWHFATRYCPRCAGRLSPVQAGHLLHCESCGRDHFPRTDPAVIMVVLEGRGEEERCLLGRNPAWPTGRYSTLAGFVEPGESLEHAVRREVLEETGVRVGRVEYFGSQPWPLPSSLMLGFIGRAESTDISVDGEEIEDARWFTRAEMRQRAEDGSLILPGGISISRSLVEWWYGAALPGQW